jgi:glutathione S-transferase
MSDRVTLYQVPPAPHNIKARLALGYKEIPYGKIDFPAKGYPPKPGEREEIVKVSGQPLTPVLAHGNRVIFDSGAILRYLDANFPDTPRIFSSRFGIMREIEVWEWFSRTELGKPLSTAFGQAIAGEVDNEILDRAEEDLRELTARVEDRLARTGWLVGDSMTAADISAAPVLRYSMLPPEAADSGPISKFLDEHLKLGDGRDRIRDWVTRVMAFDR